MHRVVSQTPAPRNSDGPLPAGLTAAAVAAAYKCLGHRPKQVLRSMNIRLRLGAMAADELRRALDDPGLRTGAEGRPALHQALYHWLRSVGPAQDSLYSRVISPAEVNRDSRVFLDPKRLSETVSAARLQLPVTSFKEDEPAWVLAHFVLAYALLQPEDAADLVSILERMGKGFRDFFSGGETVGQEADQAKTLSGESADRDSLTAAQQQMRQELASLTTLLTAAVDDLVQRDQHPSREVGAAIVAFCESFERFRAETLEAGVRITAIGELRTLRDVEAALAESETRSQVADVVARIVARLARVDGRAEPVLAAIVVGERSTAHSIDEVNQAARDLENLVRGLETLGDDELQSLRDSVARVFGTELARLASRGLLLLRQDSNGPGDDGPVRDSLPAGRPDGVEAPVVAPPVVGVDPSLAIQADARLTEAEDPDVLDDEETAEIDSGELPAAGDEVATTGALTALRGGRMSLVYQIALCHEEVGQGVGRLLPAAVAGAAALAPHIRFSTGELSQKLNQFVESIFELTSDAEVMQASARRGVVSLAACAMLRPALLAPRTNANELLAQLVPYLNRFPELKQVASSVHRFSQLGLELTPAVLKGVREHAAWTDRLADVRNQAIRWIEHERLARIIYAPATDVWRHWLKDDGLIGRRFSVVQSTDRTKHGVLADAGAQLRDRTFIEDQVAKTDKLLRGRSANLRPIEARANGALVKRAAEAADLLERVSAVVDAEPRPEAALRNREAEQCRQAMHHQIPAAISELDGHAARSTDLLTVAACGAAASLLSNLQGLFDQGVEIANAEPQAREAHSSDLLAIPRLNLDQDWEVPKRTADLLSALVELAMQPATDWQAAFDRHVVAGDHVATRRLIEYLEASETTQSLHVFRSRRDHELHERRSKLLRDLSAVRSRLNQAVMLDLLSETELLALSAELDSVDAKACESFEEPDARLEAASRQIDRAEQLRAAQVRERFKAAEGGMSGAMVARIEAALEKREFFVANDLIDAASEGRTVDDGQAEDPFRLFFPQFAREMTEFLGGRPQVRELINDIRSQRTVGPVDMLNVPGAQASDAARMLEAWFRLKKPSSDQNLGAVVKELLEGLGFGSIGIEGRPATSAAKSWSCQVTVAPVADRDTCVIPAFGSGARGHYRVLCVWDRPSEDEVFTTVTGMASQAPCIVLYLGQMSEQRRRDMALLARQRRRTFLLVDECLLFFLCRARGARLPLLFSCSLPFTVSDPYVTTASLVPPEMFFGRVVEREAIVNEFGTNLVYGGRQLGKTALLRDIERRHDNPGQGQVVRWIDLQAERIGITRPLEDVWEVIGSVLHSANAVPAQTLTADRIVRKVTAWLAENKSRRILLLLDEADVFLHSDSRNGFSQLATLKGLMDSSERRFKVVFAGLHNVQRASRDPNTPLAHLGQPVCIGPLLNDREAREALGLATRPLAALGYRFETPDLPLRIVSYSNYYPSLIQIYCKHLLEYLADPGKSLFDPRQSPPYLVTAAHLDAVQNNELREKILDKFRLTLNLDPRYKVIALCMAHAGAGESAAAVLVGGVSPDWVRNEAIYWWPAGFDEDSSIEGFRTILDEMIGLGILRRADERRYALRSPNIINLLGNRAEIDAALVDAPRHAPVPAYEAATFRRADRVDTWQRSPLTAQQEAEILQNQNGVIVACGSKLSGIDALGGFLRLACESVGYEDGTDITDGAQLIRRVEALFDREVEGLNVLHVTSVCPWSEKWLESALEVIERKTSRRRHVRVVFEADARQLWTLAESSRAVLELGLRPWSEEALKRWLHDTGIAAGDADAWQKISEATGRWSGLLAEFARRVHAGEGRWQVCLENVSGELTRDGLHRLAGIPTEASLVLGTMADYGDPVSVTDLADLCSQRPERVRHALAWAERLAYLKAEAQDHWTLTPFLRSKLRPGGGQPQA